MKTRNGHRRVWALVRLAAALSLMTGSLAAASEGQVISGRGSDVSETGLGNLVADAVRRAAGADIAFVPAGTLRAAELRVAEITPETLPSAVVDPEESIAVLGLTGAQVREALERSVSLAPKSNRGFLQISGLLVKYELSRPPMSRVTDVKAGQKPLEDTRVYRVAMPAGLAAGGLGYFRVWGDTKPARDGFGTLGSALEAFAAARPDYSLYTTEGRVRRSS
jgi:2',3'-cyclic-nucleotide 2'-phosphodiesterase (5'-nucleotidase family)